MEDATLKVFMIYHMSYIFTLLYHILFWEISFQCRGIHYVERKLQWYIKYDTRKSVKIKTNKILLQEFKDELETNDDACMVDGEDSGGNNLFVFKRETMERIPSIPKYFIFYKTSQAEQMNQSKKLLSK